MVGPPSDSNVRWLFLFKFSMRYIILSTLLIISIIACGHGSREPVIMSEPSRITIGLTLGEGFRH